MRTFLRFLLLTALVFLTSRQLPALTIPVSEDTFANGNALTKAMGAATSLSVDSVCTSYLYFDLSDLPKDTVVIQASRQYSR
jgi:hypothetical protein